VALGWNQGARPYGRGVASYFRLTSTLVRLLSNRSGGWFDERYPGKFGLVLEIYVTGDECDR
jgi:hypothetical protein